MEKNPSKKSKTQPMPRLGDEPPPPAAVHVPHLPEDIVTEILTRLPGESVLRARSVSRAWLRIATDSAFLAAHARRRPLKILLRTTVTLRPWGHPDGYSGHVMVDTIAVSADQAGRRRRLISYPHPINEKSICGSLYYNLVASSNDGVLLLNIYGSTYHICNPVTRQWMELPRLPDTRCWGALEYGFYHHQPSGDYRLLCRCISTTTTANMLHYVLSTGATEPRLLSIAEDVDKVAIAVITTLVHFNKYSYVPVPLHGRLHWLSPVGNMLRLVAFDTTSETFHLMTPPPTDVAVRTILFTMDGLLVAAEFGHMRIGLWFLEDYGSGSERWECRHQFANHPMLENPMSIVITDTDVEGDIILGTIQGIVAYNVKKKMWRVIEAGNTYGMLCHTFKESLVQHQCFKERPTNGLASIKFS